MTNNRFQLLLTTCLAMATGGLCTLLLGSGSAQGYPAGAAVSYGQNPIVAYGGNLTNGSTTTITTAPEDHDIVVTDVVLTPDSTDVVCSAILQFRLALDATTPVGTYAMQIKTDGERSYTNFSTNMIAQYESGIRVPAGSSLQATVQHSQTYNCVDDQLSVSYSISGYRAQS